MLIKIQARQALPMVILNHCLGLLENCHRVSSFECLPSSQGVEFVVTWDTITLSYILLMDTYFGEAGSACVWATGAGRIAV